VRHDQRACANCVYSTTKSRLQFEASLQSVRQFKTLKNEVIDLTLSDSDSDFSQEGVCE